MTGKVALPDQSDGLSDVFSCPGNTAIGNLYLGEQLAREKKHLFKEALDLYGRDRYRAAKLLGTSRAS